MATLFMKYEYKNTPEYKKWEEVKERIKSQFPDEIFKEKPKMDLVTWQKYWKQYQKLLANEIFKPNSVYQEFTWRLEDETEHGKMKEEYWERRNNGDYNSYNSEIK